MTNKPFQIIRQVPYEFLIQRILFSLVLIYVGFQRAEFTGEFFPIGLAKTIDIFPFFNPPVFWIFKGLFLIAILLYIANKYMPAAVSYLFLYIVVLGTFLNSQGYITHVGHIVPFVLLGHIVAYSIYAIKKKSVDKPKYSAGELAVHYSNQAIVAIYMLAGIMKVYNSGICWKSFIPYPCWVRDTPLLGLKVLRNQYRDHSNTLVGEALDHAIEWGNSMGGFLVEHPNFSRIFIGSALFLELFAFLALINRKWCIAFGILLMCLHLCIDEMMRLNFEIWIITLAIFMAGFPLLLANLFQWGRGRFLKTD